MHGTGRSSGLGARGGSRLATLAYVAVWMVAATTIIGVLLAALDSDDPEVVSLPPVHETELADAARDAGCELRRARPGERLNPAVVGGIGAMPAEPGSYEQSPGEPALLAALRDGVVVIQFRDLDGAGVELLHDVQEAVPEGTIVTPNDTGMPFAVAVTAYRRLLGCRELDDTSVDAIQLFRGRFVGSGPDS
jgi:hypothetical protein